MIIPWIQSRGPQYIGSLSTNTLGDARNTAAVTKRPLLPTVAPQPTLQNKRKTTVGLTHFVCLGAWICVSRALFVVVEIENERIYNVSKGNMKNTFKISKDATYIFWCDLLTYFSGFLFQVVEAVDDAPQKISKLMRRTALAQVHSVLIVLPFIFLLILCMHIFTVMFLNKFVSVLS